MQHLHQLQSAPSQQQMLSFEINGDKLRVFSVISP